MKTRILVVDDDDAVRSAFQLALDASDYEVHGAENVDAGLSFLAGNRIDLMFVDLNMPRRTGIDLLREFRREDRVTPVFIVTAFAEQFMTSLKRAAADGLHFNLLRKPLDIDEIKAAARGALGEACRTAEEDSDTCTR